MIVHQFIASHLSSPPPPHPYPPISRIVVMSSVSHVDPSWDPYASFQALFHAPVHHLTLEALLVIWVLWLLFRKSYRPEPVELTEEEKNQLIQEWQPEPLVPETPQDHYALNPKVVSR